MVSFDHRPILAIAILSCDYQENVIMDGSGTEAFLIIKQSTDQIDVNSWIKGLTFVTLHLIIGPINHMLFVFESEQIIFI